MDNISAAFVNNGITVLVSNDDPLEQEAIAAALKDLKIKISDFKKAEQMPF